MNREMIKVLEDYQKLYERAEYIAHTLGYGCGDITFDVLTSKVHVTWEETTNCSGSRDYEKRYEWFPFSYFWEDTYLELNEVRVAEEKRLQEERKKKQELESEINSITNKVKTLTAIFAYSEQQWIRNPSKVTEARFIIAKDDLEKVEEALKQLCQKKDIQK